MTACAELFEWTVHATTGVDGYNWPYGIRALIAERKRVHEIECLRSVFEYGHFVSQTDPNIFKFPLSYEEAFVRSDTQRIALMDRLCVYSNFNWKRDAMARAGPRPGVTPEYQQHQFQHQFRPLKMEAEQLFVKRTEDLLLLQGLTEELKPETLELVKRCMDFQQLKRCMLYAKVEIV
jgi:hypothetical protein